MKSSPLNSFALAVCSLLAIAFINNCAEYKIKNQNKKKIVVDDPKKFKDDDLPAFSVKITPDPADLGKDILFAATCGSDAVGTVTWKFSDGYSEKGLTVTRAFLTASKYSVEVTCEIPKQETQSSTATFTVEDLSNPNQNPGQNPGQTP